MEGVLGAPDEPLRRRAISAVLAGLAFFAAPPLLIAFAISLRTSGRVDSRGIVETRLREFLPAARRAAASRQVDLSLLLAVASVESAGRPSARSGAGAVGLMQLLPATARELAAEEGRPDPPNLTDPAVSLDLGAKYLARQLNRFRAEPAGFELALCAYNAGPGAVSKWLADDPPRSSEKTLGAWIPFGETRAFVRRVREWQETWQVALTERGPPPSPR